jgi:hypothetical protein
MILGNDAAGSAAEPRREIDEIARDHVPLAGRLDVLRLPGAVL